MSILRLLYRKHKCRQWRFEFDFLPVYSTRMQPTFSHHPCFVVIPQTQRKYAFCRLMDFYVRSKDVKSRKDVLFGVIT